MRRAVPCRCERSEVSYGVISRVWYDAPRDVVWRAVCCEVRCVVGGLVRCRAVRCCKVMRSEVLCAVG